MGIKYTKYQSKYWNKIIKVEKLDIFKSHIKDINQYINQIIEKLKKIFSMISLILNF